MHAKKNLYVFRFRFVVVVVVVSAKDIRVHKGFG